LDTVLLHNSREIGCVRIQAFFVISDLISLLENLLIMIIIIIISSIDIHPFGKTVRNSNQVHRFETKVFFLEEERGEVSHIAARDCA